MRVTLEDFAKEVEVPLKTVYRWNKKKDFPGKKLSGEKKIHVDFELGKKWIKDNPLKAGRPIKNDK